MSEKIIGIANRFYARLEKLGKTKEGILVWGFFSLLVFGVICLFGTVTSGYHLVDDWEFAKYVEWMSPGRENFWACMKEAVGYDLTLRFRPLYYINRVCMAAIFGVNLTAMSVVKAIEIVLALGFLYYCARQMKCMLCVIVFFNGYGWLSVCGMVEAWTAGIF